MASSTQYHPTSKFSKPNTNIFPLKKSNIYTLPLVLFLCSCSYYLGLWQHRSSTSRTTSSRPFLNNMIPCKTIDQNKSLDFSTHHSLNNSITSQLSETIKTYAPCEVKYSEYTPCEDQKRSLVFSRERLIYRERHCPDKQQVLKCRVPAPYGYKNPFSWPRSRDLAWFANVPHKELTVEKAVQNWIIYEGDTFRFPGGGTMFPNGADAYIDDIDSLIDLKSGSIRTAIDTGCGVIKFLSFLHFFLKFSFFFYRKYARS